MFVMIYINQDISKLIGSAVWRHSKRCTVRLSFIFVNALCFLSLSEIPIHLIQQHQFCLLSTLLHFDHMSHEDGDIIFFRSLEIMDNKCGKHRMYLIYFITIARSSKF